MENATEPVPDQYTDTYNWFKLLAFLLLQNHFPEITYEAGAEGKKWLCLNSLVTIMACLNGLETI